MSFLPHSPEVDEGGGVELEEVITNLLLIIATVERESLG